MLLLLLAVLVHADFECPESWVYCSPHNNSAWVDGLLGCKQFYIDHGGDPANAVCEDGRCKNDCVANNCDLNDSCVGGVCYNGCTTGSDCQAGNVFFQCNNFISINRTYAFATSVVGTVITYTNFTITFCEGFCSLECNQYTGRPLPDFCSECITGADCSGGDYCDWWGNFYANAIGPAFYPGDPVFDTYYFQKRRCQNHCHYDIGDAQAGIYVNRNTPDTTSITNMDPIPAPDGRFPIVKNGTLIHALPGVDNDVKTCVVPSSSLQCDPQDKYNTSYVVSYVTKMDFPSPWIAAYCVDKCPRFSGYETDTIHNCKQCSTLALNRCQFRFSSGERNVCDAFSKFLPGDPYNVAGWNVCTKTCHGAVNGSGWSPCDLGDGGGCCDRCDNDQLACLWGCSVGPKCNVDAFHSGLLFLDLVGACEPMCSDDIVWTT